VTHSGDADKIPYYRELAEESAEELYENAPCGYLSTLPDGTFVKINLTFLRWLGYGREELLAGRKFQELLTVGGKIFYETHFAPLLKMQGFVNEINFDFIRQSRDVLPGLVNAVQIKSGEGVPLLNRITVFNISDRKRYEQELLLAKKKAEEAARVKAEFLSTISHEIRTPMNAIIGITNLLLRTDPKAQQLQYLNILKFSSDNLLNLINDILDFSKIEAGKMTLEERPFNLRELTYSIFYSLTLKAEEKGLAMRVLTDEAVPEYLIGDPVKIGQVLTNLLSNAIKFTEQGSVTIDLRVKERKKAAVVLQCKVADTGIGIPADRLDKVFEEFTQASYEVSVKYGGTGLGLTISQRILEMYGSKMTVASEPGQGTTFSFDLALQVGQQPALSGAGEETSPEDKSIKGVRVLLVEDNPVNVFVAGQFLKAWEVVYEVAENGFQALEKVSHHDYDVVLMDLQMPELDGYEASRRIRELPHPRYQSLPIIALSASTKFALKERLEASRITDFVSKPFNPDELKARIAFYATHNRPAAPAAETPATPPPTPFTPEQEPVSAPVINLGQYHELTVDDPDAFAKLVGLTLTNFEESKNGFRGSLAARDVKAFRFCAHKIRMNIEMLKATRLGTALDQGRKTLEKESETARVEEASQRIGEELEAVIAALQEALAGQAPQAGAETG
jgi:PAS domain S-box-containing protein